MPIPDGFVMEGAVQGGNLPAGFQLEKPISERVKSMSDYNALSPEERTQFKQGQIANAGANPWGSGLPALANKFGEAVTDFAANHGAPDWLSAGLGAGTNTLTQAVPMALTSASLEAAPAASALNWPAKKLMQSAIKPQVANLERGKVDRAVQTMLEGGYSPTNSGVNAMKEEVGGLAKRVADIIAPSNKIISVAPAAQNVAEVANVAKEGTMGMEDASAAMNVARNLYSHPAVDELGTMTTQAAQAMKQANYKKLGDAAYGLGIKPPPESDALKALTRALRVGIEEAEPAVAPLNARASDLANAIKVSQRRALIEANKDIMPLGASIATAASNPAAALGLWANSSAATKAALAHLLYGIGKPQVMTPIAIGASQAYQADSAPSEQQMMAQQLRGR